MDIQTVCLGILSFGEATGYDIKRDFERTYRHFFAAGYGSIYPALGALARDGLLVCREEDGRGARRRKLYSLTNAGRRELRKRLADATPRHRVHSDFMMLMFLAERMDPARVDALIGERLDEVRAYLALIAERAPRAGRRGQGAEFTRGLGLEVLRATARYLETNRSHFIASLDSRRRGEDSSFEPLPTGDPG